jgi:hypothetical protein
MTTAELGALFPLTASSHRPSKANIQQPIDNSQSKPCFCFCCCCFPLGDYYKSRVRADPAFGAIRSRTRTTHWWWPPATCRRAVFFFPSDFRSLYQQPY